jgi:flavin-dependent dehydrogenase
MRYDAIVIGAGPAGSTAAMELARQGRIVAIVEKASFPRRKVCGEFLSATTAPILRHLGIEEIWRERAGPEVRRVALFAGERMVEAPMPAGRGYGRALGRDVLDGMLLDAARSHGAQVHQPCRATALRQEDGVHQLTVASPEGETTLAAPVLIAAHGSWERGTLPTALPKTAAPSDMLAFKAHFRSARLPAGTMPLLAFPGGYGGMVWADDGRLSVSCCIRRDVLTRLRDRRGGAAGEVVETHLASSCRGVREVLDGARLDGRWLATGPIRPGLRPRVADGVFRVGNLAGEAHPVIAEGISMAIQSGFLLARELRGVTFEDAASRHAVGRRYSAAWSRRFAVRLCTAQGVASLAARARQFDPLVALIEMAPSLLTAGARLSGKANYLALS